MKQNRETSCMLLQVDYIQGLEPTIWHKPKQRIFSHGWFRLLVEFSAGKVASNCCFWSTTMKASNVCRQYQCKHDRIVISANQPVWFATLHGCYVATYDNALEYINHITVGSLQLQDYSWCVTGPWCSACLSLRNGDMWGMNNFFGWLGKKGWAKSIKNKKWQSCIPWVISLTTKNSLLQVYSHASKFISLFNKWLDKLNSQITWQHL